MSAERAKGDVELAAGERAGLGGLASTLSVSWLTGHGRDAGVLVHADDVAAVLPDAEQRFEAIEFAKHVLEGDFGLALARGPRDQAQRGPHRHARLLHHSRRRRFSTR